MVATITTVLRIEDTKNNLLPKLLCYPRPTQEEFHRRLKQLRALEIEELVLDGPCKVNGISVVGRGCDSLVVKTLMKGKLAALKIRRVDSHVKTLLKEAKHQEIANSIGIGAKLYLFSEDFIVMEFIDGTHIDRFIHQAPKDRIMVVIKDLLEQCRRLDLAGLDHGELSRARRHVIVSHLRPVIIDFGSSSMQRRPSNIPSIFSFLFLSKTELSRLLHQKLDISFSREEAIRIIHEYKRSLSNESFERMLELIALSYGGKDK